MSAAFTGAGLHFISLFSMDDLECGLLAARISLARVLCCVHIRVKAKQYF